MSRLAPRILAIILAAPLAACGPTTASRPRRAAGVILVSIDCLRADHVGAYGYAKPTTPHIDALRRDSVLFSEAIAHAPSTLPSHASILTSVIPHHHGAFLSTMTGLSPELPTLAEALRGAGFATASFNGGGQIDATFGVGRGFEVYETPAPLRVGADGSAPAWPAGDVVHDRFATVVDAAAGWLGKRAGRPFFLFLHTYEAHHPYTPDAAARSLLPETYAGPLPADISIDLLERINARQVRTTVEDRAHIVHAYDAEVRSVDQSFGRLVERLKASGVYDDTLLIVTSDHGEEFGEHGKMGWHSHTLYDELLRVPLVVKFPGSWQAGRTMGAQVRSIDIAPTILSVAGVGAPATFEGADLVRYVGEGRQPPPYAVSAIDGGGTAVRSREWKWNQRALFRLTDDSGEQTDVKGRYPKVAEELLQIKRGLVRKSDSAGGQAVEPDVELRERLRSLGYVK